MTNPNNAVGTNGAFGGRTSVDAFNDGLASYSAGIMSGWACEPSSGLTVILGGDGNTRDVAIAEDNAGNKTTINNISGSPISVTVGAAPNSNSRIDSIVAYVDNPPTGSSTATDNYGACGLIVVPGTVASTPVPPSESTIRTAITADGASGTTAYYVVLANVIIANGTTDIDSTMIKAGEQATVGAPNLGFNISTVDSNGWTKIPLGDKMNLYVQKGYASSTTAGSSWSDSIIAQKPVDLNLSNKWWGVASSIAADNAINTSAIVTTDTCKVQVQRSNMYPQQVTATIYWQALVVEIIQ